MTRTASTSTQPRARARSRGARRGYTIVEVISAMTLFAIGAAGVISMQRVTIQGGDDARRYDMATNVAHEWEHRLQRDSFFWTEPNSMVSTSNQDTTRWLHAADVADTPTDWKIPADGTGGPGDPGFSHAFDLLGHDIDPASVDHVFCVQYRLGWIAKPSVGESPTAIIRAEIRVFWSRLEYGPADCTDINIYDDTKKPKHHYVFVTTALRGNPTK
jgi:prepilin-type N-terminal cleavage/methylation domain-containing protein